MQLQKSTDPEFLDGIRVLLPLARLHGAED